MKERGILFTPENHRLILSEEKVQTRRVADTHGEGMHYGKKLCEWDLSSPPFQITEDLLPLWRWRGNKPAQIGGWAQEIQTDVDDNVTYPIRNPYGVPGDLLYVKERVIVNADSDSLVGYYMDGARERDGMGTKRLTAMFMPKRAARTWLEITDVRVERLQDISEEDAIAEGVEQRSASTWRNYFEDCALHSAQQSYSSLWQRINGKNKPGEEWDAWDENPFVWVLEFRRINDRLQS